MRLLPHFLAIISHTTDSSLLVWSMSEQLSLKKKKPDVSFLCIREMYKIVKEKDNFRRLQGGKNTEIIRKNNLIKLFLGSKENLFVTQ